MKTLSWKSPGAGRLAVLHYGVMERTKSWLFLALALLLLGGFAEVMIAKRRAESREVKVARSEVAQTAKAAQSASARPEREVPPKASTPPEKSPPHQPLSGIGPPNTSPDKVMPPTTQGMPPATEQLKDPVARMALAWVGADAESEAYWYAAINDPALPPNERQDLIEDLNEDGLSDPKHPTTDDLPLIVSRLLLVEEVGGDAMDAVNADAFQEAYKDLVNLANLAMGAGEPVR